MKNADMPAMPIHEIDNVCSGDGNEGPFLSTRISTGLTKREMFAMHFHAALLTACDSDGQWCGYNANACDIAVGEADKLLAALEQQK